MADDNTCSRCENALDTNGFPKWCKKCRAAYKREYDSLKAQMTEQRGFSAGVSAMRDILATEFERMIPFGNPLTAQTVAHLIRQAPGPMRQTPQSTEA